VSELVTDYQQEAFTTPTTPNRTHLSPFGENKAEAVTQPDRQHQRAQNSFFNIAGDRYKNQRRTSFPVPAATSAPGDGFNGSNDHRWKKHVVQQQQADEKAPVSKTGGSGSTPGSARRFSLDGLIRSLAGRPLESLHSEARIGGPSAAIRGSFCSSHSAPQQQAVLDNFARSACSRASPPRSLLLSFLAQHASLR
jgi:hypothetical protein